MLVLFELLHAIPTQDMYMYVYLCVCVLTVFLICASREYLDSKTLKEKPITIESKQSRQWSKLRTIYVVLIIR